MVPDLGPGRRGGPGRLRVLGPPPPVAGPPPPPPPPPAAPPPAPPGPAPAGRSSAGATPTAPASSHPANSATRGCSAGIGQRSIIGRTVRVARRDDPEFLAGRRSRNRRRK